MAQTNEDKNQNNEHRIDTDRLGSNYQKKAQEIADDLHDPQNRIEKPKEGHDPYPSRSSKRAAIRTYKDYAAKSLREGGGSLTQMILAEREKKRQQERAASRNPKNIAQTLLAAALVTIGLGIVLGSFFLVRQIQEDPRKDQILTPEPLIIYDYRSEIYISDPNRNRLVRAIENEIDGLSIEAGALKYIYFATDNQYNAKILMTTQTFLSVLRAKISGTLSRNLDDNFMYGAFSTTKNAPFLIFKTKNYTTTYAEMLDWERSMAIDLAEVLDLENFDFARSNFVDVVYYNQDARAVLDQEGNPIIGYSFVDTNTLVIFSHRLAFKELVARLQQNTFQ
ncbi:MAG: hypothetical protein ACKKL4_03110 [Patescibacteria group bacterium]